MQAKQWTWATVQQEREQIWSFILQSEERSIDRLENWNWKNTVENRRSTLWMFVVMFCLSKNWKGQKSDFFSFGFVFGKKNFFFFLNREKQRNSNWLWVELAGRWCSNSECLRIVSISIHTTHKHTIHRRWLSFNVKIRSTAVT